MKFHHGEKISLNCFNRDLSIVHKIMMNESANCESECSRNRMSLAEAFVNDISFFYTDKDFKSERSQLGSGFFAEVYLVFHRTRNIKMAFKTPKSTESINKFFKEIKLLKFLENENILRFYGTCLYEGEFGFLSEFLDSGTLSGLIEKQGQYLDWGTRVHIAEDIAKGLSYLHQKHIVHRDLSAENILLNKKRQSQTTSEPIVYYRAVIADFGLFLNMKQPRADRRTIVGNPFYTAPEILKNEAPYDYSSDVFSFGMLLCELITGLKNDPNQIPRTNNFGLDYKKLPIQRDCPKWIQGLACDCCMVHISNRPTMVRAIQTISENKQYINLWQKRPMRQLSNQKSNYSKKSMQFRKMSLSVSHNNYKSPSPCCDLDTRYEDSVDSGHLISPKTKSVTLYRHNSVDSFLEPRLFNFAKASKDPGYIDEPLAMSMKSLDPRVPSKLSRCGSESTVIYRSRTLGP